MHLQPNLEQDACAECGAPRVEGMSCWEQFGALLAWEWQDPALQAAHFLIVASYNLQHPAQFTDEALAGLRTALVDYLENDATIAHLRGRISHLAEGKTRVLRREAERQPVLRRWRMTIADVYLPGRPEGAAMRVKTWVAAIREEM
ncbi:MAG: hypothetical protein IAE81_03835 [Caldilineaceae bacterium]|nr:hypothetical protein [Caldilineaceae bacterium]